MKNVLLTGASGFIGRHSVSVLREKGFQVHAVVSREDTPAQDEENLVWHQVDLLDHRQIDRICKEVAPTHLLHFAWYTAHGLFWHSDHNLDWVIASLQLVKAFHKYGGQRVVAAGTCAEYDWNFGYCSEGNTPLNPSNLYGTAKNSLNGILSKYTERNKISYAWGRIFFLYGPYEFKNRLIPYVITSLIQGRPAECTHGEQIRDFMHVMDVADAFVALLDSDFNGNVNVASGSPVSIRNIVETIGTIMGKPELIHLGERPDPPDDPPLIVADARRLKSELKWTPRYNLEAGLRSTIAWWQRHIITEETHK
jgi:nucleoside-diphosphate-sugar epimerase